MGRRCSDALPKGAEQQTCNRPSNLHVTTGLSATLMSAQITSGNILTPRRAIPQMPLNPFAVTTFCDDIRYETGGKFSLIGVYHKMLIFPGATFPFILNRLGLSITFVEHPSAIFADIDVHVLLPGDVREKPAPAFKIKPREAQQVPDDPEGTRRTLHFYLRLGPLTIRESGLIKVRLINKGRRYRAGALLVAPPTHWRLRPSQGCSAETAHHSTQPCASENGKGLTIVATGECQSTRAPKQLDVQVFGEGNPVPASIIAMHAAERTLEAHMETQVRAVTTLRQTAALVLLAAGLGGYALAGGAIAYFIFVTLSSALSAGVP